MSPDPRNHFLTQVKGRMVDDARQEATSQEAFVQPSPNGKATVDGVVVWTVKDLEVQVDCTLPSPERSSPRLKKIYGADLVAAVDLVRALPQTNAILEEIADFPTGLVFRREQQLTLAKLRKTQPELVPPTVRNIAIGFLSTDTKSAQAATPKMGASDLGFFDPPSLGRSYKVGVRFRILSDPPGVKYWPCPEHPQRSIEFEHKTQVSLMAGIVGHELLHIWFMYKFWFYFLPPGRSRLRIDGEGFHFGHGQYKPREGERKEADPPAPCDEDYFDSVDLAAIDRSELVAGRLWPTQKQPLPERGSIEPFRVRLQEFFAAVDRAEAAQ